VIDQDDRLHRVMSGEDIGQVLYVPKIWVDLAANLTGLDLCIDSSWAVAVRRRVLRRWRICASPPLLPTASILRVCSLFSVFRQ